MHTYSHHYGELLYSICDALGSPFLLPKSSQKLHLLVQLAYRHEYLQTFLWAELLVLGRQFYNQKTPCIASCV